LAVQSPQILLLLAWLLHSKGGEPAPLLRGAIDHHPRDFWLHFALATYTKDPVEQMATLQATLAIRPQSGIAHFRLAYALVAKKETKRGIEQYRQAIALHPNLATAYSN